MRASTMQGNMALIQSAIMLVIQAGEAARAGHSASITAIPDPAEVARVNAACRKPMPDAMDKAAQVFVAAAVSEARTVIRSLLAVHDGADAG